MRVLFCGDRNWTNKYLVLQELIALPKDSIVIEGAARGADSIAGELAQELGIPVLSFVADWNKHGKSAGPIRNRVMLDQKPDLVLAFHNNIEQSKGTRDCITEAKRRGIETRVIHE